MVTINGDQIVFFIVAAILLFCLGTTYAVLQKHHRTSGENFWLWGLFALAISYIGYGSSPWTGRLGLMVANLGFLLSYVYLGLQLRFWQTGKTHISAWVYAVCALYLVSFEIFRDWFPYIARASIGQAVIFLLTGYLVWSSMTLYKKWRSFQILMLSATFAIEGLCALARLIMLWSQPESTTQTTSILTEPLLMIVVRWVWVLANAMSYLTLMTFMLERIFNRNEDLQFLLKENRQLASTMSKITRSHHAGYMASALMHELSQPLTALLILSKNLQTQITQKNTMNLEKQVDILVEESERSANIMQQIDELLRTQKVGFVPVSISYIINRALHMMSPRLEVNNILIDRQCDLDVTIHAEPTQLELVFINLISNAINILSTRSGEKKIRLGCTLTDRTCEVTIQDNGPGIDPIVLQNIGQIYNSNSEQGTGIGLWLSNLIVDNHRGELNAQNLPSGGALFTIRLPLTKT